MQDGDLKVWWIPQVPCEPFEVEVSNIVEAKLLMDSFADYDTFQLENHIKTWGGSSDKRAILDLAKSGLSVAGVIDLPTGELPSPAAVAKLVEAARNMLESRGLVNGGIFGRCSISISAAAALDSALAPFKPAGNAEEFNRPMGVPGCGARVAWENTTSDDPIKTVKLTTTLYERPVITLPIGPAGNMVDLDLLTDQVLAAMIVDEKQAPEMVIGVDPGSKEGDYSVKATVSAEDMAKQIILTVRRDGQCDREDEGAGRPPMHTGANMDDDRNQP